MNQTKETEQNLMFRILFTFILFLCSKISGLSSKPTSFMIHRTPPNLCPCTHQYIIHIFYFVFLFLSVFHLWCTAHWACCHCKKWLYVFNYYYHHFHSFFLPAPSLSQTHTLTYEDCSQKWTHNHIIELKACVRCVKARIQIIKLVQEFCNQASHCR